MIYQWIIWDLVLQDINVSLNLFWEKNLPVFKIITPWANLMSKKNLFQQGNDS